MARIATATNVILNSDTTITKSANTVFPTVVNIQEAIGGTIEMRYGWATAPAASKSLKVYLLYSENGVDFDTNAKETAQCVATFALDADTADQQVTIPLDAGWLAGKFVKIMVFTDEATNNGTMKNLSFTVKKAV